MAARAKLTWHFGLKMVFAGMGFIVWLLLNIVNKRRRKYTADPEISHAAGGSTHAAHGLNDGNMTDGLIFNKLMVLNMITIIFSFLIINEYNLNQANNPLGVEIQRLQPHHNKCYTTICAGYFTLIALIGLLFIMNVYMSLNAIDVATDGDIPTTTPTTTGTGRHGTTPGAHVIRDASDFASKARTLHKYDKGQFVRENTLNPAITYLLRFVSFASIGTYFTLVMIQYFGDNHPMSTCLDPLLTVQFTDPYTTTPPDTTPSPSA